MATSWLRPWELGLLALCAGVAVTYVMVGLRVRGFVYEDAAYYYGVARHMALTGRFEEPIVWHFLQPPARIIHAPFDYWGCATSLLLVPPMMLFGATPKTALITMSVVSAASVLAFWYLVCFALPLRRRATQLLALVLFAFSPAMDVYRFQPESVSLSHLFILLSLIAFCRQRWMLSILTAFCILLTRGDGMILFTLISLAVLVRAGNGVEGDPSERLSAGLVALACVAVYVSWSLASFGSLTPPASRMMPFLDSYTQVYDFGVAHQPSFSRQAVGRLDWHYLADRTRLAFTTLRGTPFTPAVDWWLAIGLIPALGIGRRRPSREALISFLCFGGYFLVALVGGAGFAPVRTPYTFTPLVVLAGALGVDSVATRLDVWVGHSPRSRVRSAVIGAAMTALCALLLFRLPMLRGVPIIENLPLPAEVIEQAGHPEAIAALDELLQGEPVASNRSLQVLAFTRSPAVSIPHNGEQAFEAVLARYEVRWLVIFGVPPMWCAAKSCNVITRMLDADSSHVGRFRVERARTDARLGLPAVFRVIDP